MPTIDTYRSFPNPYYSESLTLGLGGTFGFTQGWFQTTDGSQFGQTTGVSVGPGVSIAGSVSVNYSIGPVILGSGLSAVEPFLVLAWPPGQNIMLNLKAHRLIRW